MNNNAKLSYLGNWTNKQSVVNQYSIIKLGSTKLNGIVMGGWAWAPGATAIQKVNIVILDQNPDGTLKINTSKYISDPSTNGAGSIIVSDFNNDGNDDIFLAAYNETPFIPVSSTAFLSQNDGTYKKILIPDSVEAHSATLGKFNGISTIVTSGYGPTDPYYQFNFKTQSFDVEYWANTYSGSIYGSSAAIGDFLGDGKSQLVIGDFKTGPGVDWKANVPNRLAVYTLDGSKLSNNPSFIGQLYFDQEKYQNKGFVGIDPGALTHNFRTWTDDFNHDGKLDILLGEGIWNSKDQWIKDKLGMFQNNGNLNFTDVTDILGKVYDENSSFVDYAMQIIDIDNSGINSYLMAGDKLESGVRQSNYLLVNDGTGKLHVALHDEFQNLSTTGANSFIAYQLSNGAINYLAYGEDGSLFNYPLQYFLSIDYKQDITVDNRNQSKLLRTWSGNDKLFDNNANTSPAHIDGGLGNDIAIYSGNRSDYLVKFIENNSFQVKLNSKNQSLPSVEDILVNIERLKFSDKSLAIDIDKNAGTTAKILGAVFGKESVSNKSYVGIGLNFLDAGWTYDNLAALALDAASAKTNDQIVSLLWTNVIGTKPTAADKQPFIALLENGMTAGALAHLAADTSFNATNINLVGLAQTGIEYIPVS